jgi:hypothetical protein
MLRVGGVGTFPAVPVISVVVPAWLPDGTATAFLPAALESLLAQTLTDWEARPGTGHRPVLHVHGRSRVPTARPLAGGAARERVWARRFDFTFDAHADELLDLFRKAAG